MSAKDIVLSAGGASAPVYVEDVFSTYLYTGNASTRDITNGIDLSTKGGMVWIKNRGFTDRHNIQDTDRGINSQLSSNLADAAGTSGNQIKGFYTNGFQLGYGDYVNKNNYNYVSWTFRKQAKFFDVVRWTGNGSNSRQIPHSLGSRPGCIIIKRTDTSSDWFVWHRSIDTSNTFLLLNSVNAKFTQTNTIDADITSTYFTVQSREQVNYSGGEYVAYVFAHNAGGFGAAGTDNVISCGSYAGNGSASGPVVDLGYEPQWLLVKRLEYGASWFLWDTMRGLTATGNNIEEIYPDSSDSASAANGMSINATGFRPTRGDATGYNASNSNYIYIAIRRPMKPPTTGTEVFSPVLGANTSTGALIYNTGFPVDMLMQGYQAGGANNAVTVDRLRGSPFLSSSLTDTEATPTYVRGFASNSGVVAVSGFNYTNLVGWNFRRAPGFFDVVCKTTNAFNETTWNHNLGVKPELAIFKMRNGAENWLVFHGSNLVNYSYLNQAWQQNYYGYGYGLENVTSTSFDTRHARNLQGGYNYVAYLFATLPGVSKVGSYTGNDGTQNIDCGFSSGARFVLIKALNRTESWYVWDTARGIVSGNDPYLQLNTTDAEGTSTDMIDPYSAGFTVGPYNEVNGTGYNYIYLAIA